MTASSPVEGFWPGPGGGTVVIYGNSTGYEYLHVDWLGNTRIASDVHANQVNADQAYSPYGEIYDIFGSNVGQYQFFGTMDSMFAPSTTTPTMWDTPNRELSYASRWLSPDPAGVGWNQYAYATNPNGFIDPSGLSNVSPVIVYQNSLKYMPLMIGESSCTIDGLAAPQSQCAEEINSGAAGQIWNCPPGVETPGPGCAGLIADPNNPNQYLIATGWRFNGETWVPTGSEDSASAFAIAANNYPNVTAAPRQPPPLKPGCTKAGLWAGLKAAGQDLIPIPPQFNPDPVGATGDFLTSKQGQAATVGVLYEVANGARYLAPFADAAADFVPVVGWAWAGYQGVHALYVGGKAYKQAIDQCYGGG